MILDEIYGTVADKMYTTVIIRYPSPNDRLIVKDQGYSHPRLPRLIDIVHSLGEKFSLHRKLEQRRIHTHERHSVWCTYLHLSASAPPRKTSFERQDLPASFPCINWNVPICLPNCFLSWVYSRAMSRAACMMLRFIVNHLLTFLYNEGEN